MKLDKLINIDGWFSRSINVERDNLSLDAINAYVLTSTGLKTLKNIANGFTYSKQPRAWSLIGPYGSGKSSFAIFLNALLQDKQSTLFKTALEKLKPLDPDLTKKFIDLGSKGGALTILVTGSYASLPNALYKSVLNSIEDIKFNKKFKSAINECILSIGKNPSSQDVINLLELIQDGLESNKKPPVGIVIAIDELGKFAEYAAKNKDKSDHISILQVLSESSVNKRSVPLFLIGMQHQSLEFYAKELDIDTKLEWKKIGGRFTEIGFLENIEQTIRIISKAIITNFSLSQTANIKKILKTSAQGIVDNKIFPDISKIRDSVNFLSSVYPLHPITAILLPTLAQKLGQNERTVFTYLGSSEQFGFQSQLRELDFPNLILPSVMYDYFVTNQASSVFDHFTHKQWVIVGEAINRLGDVEANTVDILKTIGLLNIVGASQNLKASNEILETIYPKKVLLQGLETLQKKSIITFRKFSNEYRVWQGSDFDFDKSLKYEIAQFESFDLASELNSLMPPLPLIAKRYSVTSGTLRIFTSFYLSEDELIDLKISDIPDTPQAILLLKDKLKMQAAATKKLKILPDHLIVLEVNSDLGLRSQAKELKALQTINSTYDEIQSDPIAKKELSDQIDHRKSTLIALLKNITNPSLSSWYSKGAKLKIKNNLDAQAKLSEVLESVYSKSPVIKNELVNKDQVSAQGQSARTKLMKDMLNNLSHLNLGYEDDKFPAEKTVFNALFVSNNLYAYDGHQGQFVEPKKGTNLFSVYEFIKKRLLQTDEPVPFAEIQKDLSAIPYGVKKGLQPLILMGFYLANEANLAVYEDGIFQPYINNEHIDRLVRKTEAFSFQMHAFEGQQAIISQYADSLFEEGNSTETNILNLVKTLSRVMKELPDYVFNTRSNLSKEAIKFRSSYNLAKSPQDLLFKDIPSALGYKPEDLKNKSKIKAFSNDLNQTLTELKQCYGNLLLDQIVKFNLAFEFSSKNNLNELRTKLRTKYLSLSDYSVDSLTLKPFLAKVLKADGDDRIWFEGLLSFLVKRDPTKWHDETISEAEVELRNISDRMKDIAKLQIYEKNNNTLTTKDIDVYVMRLTKKGFDEQDFITMFNKNDQAKYDEFKEKMLKVLNDFSADQEDHLTFLAPLLDEMLNNKIEVKKKLKIVKRPKD